MVYFIVFFSLDTLLSAAESNEIDPLCKLVSDRVIDPNNQHYRLCSAVSNSSYFKGKYSGWASRRGTCTRRKVSFRTVEGIKNAADTEFYERMIFCGSTSLGPGNVLILYISRAYLSNHVLVYQGSRHAIYLENLSANISVVDELNSFDFIEY